MKETKELKEVLTKEQHFQLVAEALSFDGNQDIARSVKHYYEGVIIFMLSAGIPESVVFSNSTVGLTANGVSDTWDYGNGKGVFSNQFKMRVIQLRMVGDKYV